MKNQQGRGGVGPDPWIGGEEEKRKDKEIPKIKKQNKKNRDNFHLLFTVFKNITLVPTTLGHKSVAL